MEVLGSMPEVFRSLPVGMFQGYNKVTGRGLSTALSGQTQSFGGTSSVRYQVCSGIAKLCEALEIDQSLTVTYLSVASMDEKLKFINSQNLTTYSTCIVIHAKHTMGKETMTDVALKDGIKRPEGSDALKEFFQVYGDSFMSARTTGGEYYAVYTFYSETWEQHSELTAEMKVQGILSPVSIDASLQLKLSKFSSSQKTRVSFDQRISGIANPKFPSADQIIQFALDFPSLQLTAPVLTNFETSGYEHVQGIGGSFNPIAHNRNLIVGEDHSTQDFTTALSLLKQLQNDISSIKNIYSFYGGYDKDTKLMQVKTEADRDVNAIQTMIKGYVADPTQTVLTPVLKSLVNGTPSLVYVIERSPRFGGDGQTPFDDVDSQAYLQQQTRISALQLRTGRVVSNLMVTYTNNNHSWKLNHGTDNHDEGSEVTPVLQVLQGRFVTSVSGYYSMVPDMAPGPVLTKLSITLSDNQSVTGGRNYGTPFQWRVPTGCFVLGFRGRYGWYLDRLEIVYASFRPAFWNQQSH